MRVPHDNEALLPCKAPMTYEEILDSFTVPDEFPEAALREASARRAEFVEPFLAEVERWIADTEAEPEEPSALFFIVHLLGSWREPRAYELICRLLRSHPERLDWEFGDALTSTLPRIVITLCEGDWAPWREVLEDDAANEFARSSLLEALPALVGSGKASREDVTSYLTGLPSRLDAPSRHPLWAGWAGAIADLRATELYPAVREAFSLGRIDPEIMTREEFEADLQEEETPSSVFAEPFGTDVVEELLGAFAFDEDAIDEAPGEPVVNPYRRVGRNDPCPCGSGKKFKRCHGA
jgi:uncharacterized protein